MIKKILAPLDGSKLAECVLPYVEEIATKLNAEVVLVTVTNRIQGYWPFEDVSKPSEIDLEPEGTHDNLLGNYRASLNPISH